MNSSIILNIIRYMEDRLDLYDEVHFEYSKLEKKLSVDNTAKNRT